MHSIREAVSMVMHIFGLLMHISGLVMDIFCMVMDILGLKRVSVLFCWC